MTAFLKQSTAVDVALGPFVDATDGVTPETALSLTQAECRLKKNAAAWAQKSDVTTAAHEEEGWYEVNLNTTDTDTLGTLVLAVYVSGALPVWREFTVLAANVYDSLIGGGDTLDVQVTGIGANVITATSINADAITDAKVAADVTIASVTGAVGSVTGAVGSVTGNVGGNVTGSVGSVATGGITTGSFAAGAINAAAIAADAIGASEIAADAVAEIADAVWDEARAGHVAAGSFGEGVVVNSIAAGAVTAAAIATDAIDSDAVAASAVTELQSGLATAAALATVQADTDDIQTRLPAALVAGRIDASVGAMAANTLTASALASDAVDEIWAKTMTELTAVPGVTGTVLEALEHVFMMLRNRRTETASAETIYQDDGTTVYATSTKSDDGTTFSSGEVTTA